MTPARGRRWFVGLVAGRGAALLAGGLALAARPGWARDTALPVPDALQAVAAAAVARHDPLVLLASRPGCPYCEFLRRSYLLPMRQEGLPAWQFDIEDRLTPLRGFAGETTNGTALAAGWKIRMTPTLLFLDTRGAELAPRLVGVAAPDFFGDVLQGALDTARKKLSEAR